MSWPLLAAAYAWLVLLTAAVAWLWLAVRDLAGATGRALALATRLEADTPAAVAAQIAAAAAPIADKVDRHDARLDRLEATRPRVVLDLEQQADLRANWPGVVCADCGLAHQGICTRVKTRVAEAETDSGGRTLTTKSLVEYWPNGEWQPPADALSAFDVWGTAVPLPDPPANGTEPPLSDGG